MRRITLFPALFGAAIAALAQVPIIQPGLPGESGQQITATDAIAIAAVGYTPDDVQFMQDMIPHHHQALQMAELVAERTNRPEIVDVAGRIESSQEDEISFMQEWLAERGETVPDPAGQRAMRMQDMMAGMATSEQMEALAAAEGTAFDRLFLELMIVHHEGAVTMVQELHSTQGAAYDPVLFEFTNDVQNDQAAEIDRMSALLVNLVDDPRVGLAAGFMDAGQAIWNLELVSTQPKPDGFFDPENPTGLPPLRVNDDNDNDRRPRNRRNRDSAEPERYEQWSRSPLLSFSNTDMAFFDDVLVAGNYHGFNIYRLTAAGTPQLISSVVCPGGQGDVSVVGNILIMSVEQTRGRLDCGLQGINEDVSNDRFRGIRIFDISDLAHPVQVAVVQTCRGSHTHSVVNSNDNRIVVYNSGTGRVREEGELAECVGDTPGDTRTALFRIDVIEIPIANPGASRIVSSPAVFADPNDEGVLAGLWRGGDHGDDTQQTNRTDQCHDITVFPQLNLAAGACSGNGILFDITDPYNPQRLDAVLDEGFAYWHSATFNNDGTKVLFTDEWGGGGRPRCMVYDPLTWGADAIYDIVDNKLEFRGYFKMPAPQTEQENCVAHNGAIVPVPGRDIFVQAWYQGGLSVMDFTDSANPYEIAFFDRGPVHPERLLSGGYWSTYYYDGYIYGTEISRGLDVFQLTPSEHLSASEIAAAALADYDAIFNPQQQFAVSWPGEPAVAQAYMGQLHRSGNITDTLFVSLRDSLAGAEKLFATGGRDNDLAARLESQARVVMPSGSEDLAAIRRSGLAETLNRIAARLR